MASESVYRALTVGMMKAQASSLSDDQKRQASEYVTGSKLGDRATPQPAAPMCHGEAAVFDYGESPIWKSWGLTPENTHAISGDLAGISRNNVRDLKLKWAFAFPSSLRARSHPMYAAGALFIGSQDGTVFALERRTGCIRWSFSAPAEVRNAIVISDWKDGDMTAKPLAYFGDIIGNVYAVDARTGSLVWSDHADPHPSTMITGSPTLYDGHLYVPVSSLEVIAAANPHYACCTFKGSVVAYDASTGTRLWQTYTVAEAARQRGKNSVGADRLGPSGVPVWNSPAIDIKRRQLYVGTGENYSSPATSTSDSVLALDLDTGKVKWVYQSQPGDAWNVSCLTPDKTNCPAENGPDHDFGAAPVLVHASDGRDYVIAGQKSGVVHAVDPDSGQEIWRNRVGRGGIEGGVLFGIAAFGDVVFVPINDRSAVVTYAEPARPGLYALDARTGKQLWQAPNTNVCHEHSSCDPGLSSAVTATPDIVWAGANDGYLRGYDTNSGKVLWSVDTAHAFDTVSGKRANGGSFGGAQAPLVYHGTLAVSSGYDYGGKMPGNVLLMFALR
jgi:polyvinyl alcohol dehydrogenase (cytochrome)